MTDPQLGKIVGERFRLTSRIGEGGMGVVYLAEDQAGGGRAAVKFLHRHLLQNADFLARFRQEAKSAGRFRHENAVRILAEGDDEDGVPWIAMEFCPGKSLKAVLREEGPLSVSRSCRIAEQILRALAAAHERGIIHRDLKPENVKVESGEDGDTIKVLDFGVAKFVGTDAGDEMTGAVKTKTGVVFGTPKYMSPEQILGEPVDARSDIYSVGAILYEMLTGTPPFASNDIMGFVTKHVKEPVERPSVRAPDRNIPEALERIVMETLEKNRVARPARAAEVADSLRPFTKVSGKAAERRGRPALAWRHLVLAAGGGLGAAASFLLVPEHAVAGAAPAAGLGVGAALAFLRFPSVGEAAFWLRLLVVAVFVGGAAAAGWAVTGDHPFLAAGLALGALFVFVLHSMGWGRRSRLGAFLLGGIVAPLLAIPLLPLPGGNEYRAIWEIENPGLEDAGPALALLALALLFALASLAAPRARVSEGKK